MPGGNDAFQYARGRTEEDGALGVFRRKASERGTYGGWRWETDANKVGGAAPAPAATNEPRHVKEMREKLGTLVAALPPEVRPIITHNYSGPSTGLIGVARRAQIRSTEIPATLESKGFTQKQWDEVLADLKEKVTGTRTEGVQAQIDKGTTVSEMLDYLIANSEPRMGKLAAALKRFGAGNPALDLPYTNLKNPPKRQRGGTRAWEGSGEITDVLNAKGVADEITTLHEITHALTLSWFYTADKKSPLYKELVQMHKDARNQWLSENPGKTAKQAGDAVRGLADICLLYTSPSPRDRTRSRMPSSA